jgi:hypothetical protein
MLEFPPPMLMAYPNETMVAEKIDALTVLGLLNSRVKDYYDLALLARLYPFDGHLLAEAIRSTFRHRATAIDETSVPASRPTPHRRDLPHLCEPDERCVKFR